MGLLCVNCGHLGHMQSACTGTSLSFPEKQILKDMVFGMIKANRLPSRTSSSPNTVPTHSITAGVQSSKTLSVDDLRKLVTNRTAEKETIRPHAEVFAAGRGAKRLHLDDDDDDDDA